MERKKERKKVRLRDNPVITKKGSPQIVAIIKEVKKKEIKKKKPIVGTSITGLTLKQEAFSQHYAKNGNGAAAYAYAYRGQDHAANSGDERRKVRRLLKHPKISNRIVELRKDIALTQAITVESLIDELGIAVGIAIETKQPSAIVQAVLAKAKLLGMLVDKTESKSVQFVIHAPRPEPTTAAWLESIRGEARELPDDSDDMKLIN